MDKTKKRGGVQQLKFRLWLFRWAEFEFIFVRSLVVLLPIIHTLIKIVDSLLEIRIRVS